MLGMAVGFLAFGATTSGAMTLTPTGHLTTGNPIATAPYGIASTESNHSSYGKATAKVTVSKSGYATKSKSVKNKAKSVETDRLYGPTWASKGTKFVSNHSGYDYKGKKWTGVASKSFN